MLPRILLLIFGVFACSTAIIMIKQSETPAMLLAAYRTLVAGVVLTPLYLRDRHRHRETIGGDWGVRRALFPGVLLGFHFITWIIAARMTEAANASLIVNLVPVVMPFLMHFLANERVNGYEQVGTVLALAGLFLLAGADFSASREHFWGDILCLVSMLFFSVYLAWARRHRQVPSTWLYVVPIYYIAGALSLLVALPFVDPIRAYPPRELLLIAGLGIVPTVIGHSILNYSMKHLRGQIVSLLNMGQFIPAGILAYFLFTEVPLPSFYLACVLVLSGGFLAIRGAALQVRAPRTPVAENGEPAE